MPTDVVIAGGGLAAVRTAQALRSEGCERSIVVLSGEDEAPYDRPPLSKAYLLGEASDEDIRLVASEKLAGLGVEVRLGCEVVGLDRDAHVARLAGGEEVGYGSLVVATGAVPVMLPTLHDRDNAHVLRTAADARGLRDALGPGVRVGIVGGGFIGLEIAAAAARLGSEVVVVEAAAAPLAPVLGDELGGHIRRWHESKGVAFECGSPLEAAHGEGAVSALELLDGRRLDVDVVVVGVGVRRNTGWLDGSGLEVGDGLICDELGRTEDPDVYGVGDVVCCRSAAGELHPTGHWTATGEQARRVAKAICGDADQGEVVHDFYFWSDQHGKRLQFMGRVADEPRLSFVLGSPEEEKYVALLSDAEHVTAVFGLASPKDFIKQSMPLSRGEKVAAPA